MSAQRQHIKNERGRKLDRLVESRERGTFPRGALS